MKYIYPAILALLLITGYTNAQESKFTPFVLGRVETIDSKELIHVRTLNIYLPDGYSKDSAYPVIYLLDGSANEDFIHIVGLVQFLNMINVLPPSIVVGIANIDRRHDFTHPTTVKEDKDLVPTSGGSEKFMAFIEKDLQPYVESHYKTTARKTIIGQSLGGLLATEILLKHPTLFTDYIIVSPSLWWDNESLLAQAPALLQQNMHQSVHVFIAAGNEGKQMQRDVEKLSDLLHHAAGGKLIVDYVPLPQENHLTILHRAVYKAFELLNKK